MNQMNKDIATDSGQMSQSDHGNNEEIEGLDDNKGDYPLDDLLIRSESRTINDVMRRIKGSRYVMEPDFQREFIWDEIKQSKLIESVIMRIPLPVFYLAEDEEGRMVVVDGLQRLSTFKRFTENELRLKIKDRDELHGRKFDDLSPKLQNRIEDCNLIMYIVDSRAPERARLDIFERVNGGVPLTRQQMRNCLFMGDATKFLKNESRTQIFLNATGRSLSAKTMRDREFVNRFCAFQILDVEEYHGDMDLFLAMALKKMNSYRESDLQLLSDQFRLGLTNNQFLFGKHAFRKFTSIDQQYRNVLNASLWDVMSTGLSRYSHKHIESSAEKAQDVISALLEDEEFVTSITYSTNDTKRVKRRFEISREKLKESLGDYSN